MRENEIMVPINKALLLKKKTFLILLQLLSTERCYWKKNILDLATVAINKALLLKKKTFFDLATVAINKALLLKNKIFLILLQLLSTRRCY